MRILYIGSIANSHERLWVLPVAQAGHEVHIISPVPAVDCPGVTVHHYTPDADYRQDHMLVRFAKKVLDMRRFVREIQPDIVHFQFVVDLAYTAPFLGHPRIVLTPWGSDILIFPKRSKIIRLFLTFALRAAQAITIHSDQILNEIKTMADVSTKKIARVAYSVDRQAAPDPAAVAKLREKHGLGSSPVLFSFRNIMPVYNLEEIITAAGLLKDRADFKFIILYEYNLTDRVAAIKDCVRQAGLEDRVVYINSVPHAEMRNYYGLATIGVSFSKSDGCPVSVLECMALGVPLVVSDIPANRQILSSQGASFAALGDTAGLALALERLLNDPDLRARQVAQAKLDMERVGYNDTQVQRLLSFYQELLQ